MEIEIVYCYMCMYWHKSDVDEYYGECGENGHECRYNETCSLATERN